MLQAAGSLASIAILLTAGLVLARKGMLGGRTVDGLKALITRVTLPLLLFRAFLQLEPEASNLTLAAAVFAACAVMGGIGVLLGRAVHLPRPETRLLFQGFEAGMLGYAFFIALHGSEHLPAFAALDMGQVVYVFTVLIVQMSILEQHNARAGAGEVPGTTAAPPRGRAGGGNGIALDNIRQRLQALYGDAASLTIEPLQPGTRATLRLPFSTCPTLR